MKVDRPGQYLPGLVAYIVLYLEIFQVNDCIDGPGYTMPGLLARHVLVALEIFQVNSNTDSSISKRLH